MNRLSKLFVCLLILSLSRLPLPWGHIHAELHGRQFAQHLRLFHPASDPSDLPQGWHWHSAWPVAAAGDRPASGPMAAFDQASRRCPAELAGTDAGRPAVSATSLADRSDGTGSSPARAARQQQTYLLLRMLLI